MSGSVKPGKDAVRCPVCDSVGKWKNVDHCREIPSGMCVCESCAFVTYPEIVANTKKLSEFYEEEYRPAPTITNIYSGEKKIHFHAAFLKDLFEKWKADGISAPVVFEVGAAFGMFLAWVKGMFPGGDISGSELTKTYVQNAFHLSGVRLKSDFDESKKYDLIASYKVAEHIPNIDVELSRYASALKDGGLLYISVPLWFEHIHNFGMGGAFDIEYYYHKNHINVWGKVHFESLLHKAGLEIVKENHTYYDSTYLCRRARVSEKRVFDFPSVGQQIEKMERIRGAAAAFRENDYAKALELYPAYLDAHVGMYERSRAELHKRGFDYIRKEVIERAIAAVPNDASALVFAADLSMRYSQWATALEYLDKGLQMRPNDASMLISIGHCFRNMANEAKNEDERIKFMIEARNVTQFLRATSTQHHAEATNWIMQDNTKIPIPVQENDAKAQ